MDSSLKQGFKKYWLFRNLANIISYYKFVGATMAIYFVIAFGSERLGLAILMYYTAIISDYFDGVIARYMDIVSENGSLLDRIGDKYSVVVFLIVMYIKYFPKSFHWVADVVTIMSAVLIIGLEIILATTAFYGKRMGGLRITANKDGKYKMGWESGSAMFLLLGVYIQQIFWSDFFDYFIVVLWYGMIKAFMYGCKSIRGYIIEYQKVLPPDSELHKLIQTVDILWATFVFVVYLIISGIINGIKGTCGWKTS